MSDTQLLPETAMTSLQLEEVKSAVTSGNYTSLQGILLHQALVLHQLGMDLMQQSARFATEATTRIGRSNASSRNTSDLAIWATAQPMLKAASMAVRVEPGNSTTSQENPRAARKSWTRRALSLNIMVTSPCR